MRTSILTPTRFHRLQETFFRAVRGTPSSAVLVLTELTPVNAFTTFTGDSNRKEKEVAIDCLEQRTFSNSQRIKYGIEETVQGIIYISPKELENKLGTFKISQTLTKVKLLGTLLIIDRVVYHAPFFSTCIAVELRLKDLNKGGN